jgi:hypothetical protein
VVVGAVSGSTNTTIFDFLFASVYQFAPNRSDCRIVAETEEPNLRRSRALHATGPLREKGASPFRCALWRGLHYSEAGAFVFEDVTDRLKGTCIFPQAKPKHAYHYTTIDGLRGILANKKLWATDLAYLNDSTEYIYANTLIEEGIHKLGAHPILSPMLTVLSDEPGPLASAFNVYASCFCQAEDLLSQWRAYSGKGTGYAIEFDLELLENRVSANPFLILGRVEYQSAKQQELIQQIIAADLEPFREADAIAANSIIKKVLPETPPDKEAEYKRLMVKPEYLEAMVEHYGKPLLKVHSLLLHSSSIPQGSDVF